MILAFFMAVPSVSSGAEDNSLKRLGHSLLMRIALDQLIISIEERAFRIEQRALQVCGTQGSAFLDF
jgi:hypothetical protein